MFLPLFGFQTGSAKSIEQLSIGLIRILAKSWIFTDWRYAPFASMILALRRSFRSSQAQITQLKPSVKNCPLVSEGPEMD